MHYVYLSLYYLSLVMMLIAAVVAGGLLTSLSYFLSYRAFATDAKVDWERLENLALSVITAVIVVVGWLLVNKLVATLGGINAL